MALTPRKVLEARYDPIYREIGSRGDPCTYCGQISDTMDHVPPISMVEQASLAGADQDGPFIKVPACLECNSIIGSKRLLTIKARRKHVKDRLRVKYQHFLRIPNWDEDELVEVSPEFAKEIRASVKFGNHVRARLAWMR